VFGCGDKDCDKLFEMSLLFIVRESTKLNVAESPMTLRVVEYFAKSLKIIQGHSK